MKVKLILKFLGMTDLKLGEVYSVYTDDKEYYYVKDDKKENNCIPKECAEIVKEENKMEKTFREVIADIKEGEVWESENTLTQIYTRNDVLIIDFKEEVTTEIVKIPADAKFRLKRKEYSFNEAFKAYEEGKEIESCENGYKYLQNTFTYPGNEQWLCFRNSEQMFTTDAIRGKWYIND